MVPFPAAFPPFIRASDTVCSQLSPFHSFVHNHCQKAWMMVGRKGVFLSLFLHAKPTASRRREGGSAAAPPPSHGSLVADPRLSGGTLPSPPPCLSGPLQHQAAGTRLQVFNHTSTCMISTAKIVPSLSSAYIHHSFFNVERT